MEVTDGPTRRGSVAARGAVALVALLGGLLSAWLGVVVVVHAGRPVHDLPVSAVVIGLAAALAAVVGWVLVGRSGDGVLLSAALLGLLLVGGVAALMSIGILLLLVGGAVAVVLGRVAGRRRSEGRPVDVRRALLAGALVGLGLPVAAIAAADGPIVECHTNGTSGSESIFRSGGSSGSSSGSGSSFSSLAEGDRSGTTSSGVMSSGGRAYRYRCAGDELVEFEATDA
jgi:hypothetical protein